MSELEVYGPVPAEGGGRLSAEQLIRRWLITKRSVHTRFAYGADLGVRLPRPGADPAQPSGQGKSQAPDWLAFCTLAGVSPLDAGEEHVALWARGMEAAGLAPATVARKLSSVSSWYKWLARHGHVPVNPA